MTSEIRCPHCGEAFTIDEAAYGDIVTQIRTREFDEELHQRLALVEQEKVTAIELAEAKLRADAEKSRAAQQSEVQQLTARLESAELAQQIAITDAVAALSKQRDDLERDLAAKDTEAQLARATLVASMQEEAAKKTAEIERLRSQLESTTVSTELAVTRAVGDIQKQRDDLARDLEVKAAEQKLLESTLKEQHGREVAVLTETIESYKDFKARLSTKMLGETLEQHCEISFERLRATGFQRATFEKDNDARTGSKGDYIFREAAEDGTEFISIMFEMKNEADATATKKRNDDFLRELDKDRTEKGCEYAVLVSTLEQESELYNDGIVDVSHRYPRMYVVRPQFFIPIITLLRNAALGSVAIRSELERAREQNLDITNFENAVLKFKNDFSYSYGHAQTQFDAAVKSIDDAIKDLEKTKDALRKSLGHLSAASNKADGLSIKALTRGNETMKAKFIELESGEG